ncbi:CHC2 zinc finger domain-containing protein [Sphingomonas sp. BK069]|uniref:CHC2 zinc finger domain-containing protein n=1 Tax=Sphingomonas sp. BK069 TaxID=2586979 RepID=UPI0016126571|nr:CHC2 zinc finger domain-containing protein [Sphingomonas sp. BK069]MBB3347337.1 DNA primase [Sphingomonas sp. BK069]
MSGARRQGRGSATRSHLDEARFRALIDDAKAGANLSDVLGRHTTLKRRGARELVGLCPFHKEKSPSFEVNDAKGTYYCHGCGSAGDHFTALKLLDGMTFRESYQALTNETFPTVDPEQRVKAAAEEAASRAAAIADARFMWDQCHDPAGTQAERYLREVRGITMPLPPTVRFGLVPTSRDEDGRWKRPYPAAVFCCTDGAGAIVGLQRVFLLDDGSGKRWGKRSKFSLGRPRGSAVRISETPSMSEVIVCEGPEDGLTLAQEMPAAAVWVTLGTSMMPELHYPPTVRSVVVAGQNDDAGRAAAEATRAPLLERGFAVRVIYPDPAFKDWNDQLRGVRA